MHVRTECHRRRHRRRHRSCSVRCRRWSNETDHLCPTMIYLDVAKKHTTTSSTTQEMTNQAHTLRFPAPLASCLATAARAAAAMAAILPPPTSSNEPTDADRPDRVRDENRCFSKKLQI